MLARLLKNILYSLLAYYLLTCSISYASNSLTKLRHIFSPQRQMDIIRLINLWEGQRPNLFDKKNKWTGKMVCGQTAAVCQYFLKKEHTLDSTRITVESLTEEHCDHSFLIINEDDTDTIIIDPTVRQFGLEPLQEDKESLFLVASSQEIPAWLNSYKNVNYYPWWLCTTVSMVYYRRHLLEQNPNIQRLKTILPNINNYPLYRCYEPTTNLESLLEQVPYLDNDNNKYKDFCNFAKTLPQVLLHQD